MASPLHSPAAAHPAAELFIWLATVSKTDSFAPLWQPRFISKLAAEDRCHLNGLAMDNGAPRYVTAVSRSDVVDGWRDDRRDGRIVSNITDTLKRTRQ